MSISEPFALATYNNLLYASANINDVSVSVQSDGVHVLQLSTLRPIISHTLGPSASFTCSPLTVSDAHKYTVYAAIQSSPGLEDGEMAGKTIWAWNDDLDASIVERAEAQKKKVTATVPHTISGLLYVPELPKHIIVFSPNGAITILQSGNLRTQSTWEPENSNMSHILKFFTYSKSGCSFLPQTPSPAGAVVVLVLADTKTGNVRVEVVSITSEETPFVSVGSYQLDFKENEILDVSFSTTGYVSILNTEGEWLSFTLDISKNGLFSLSQSADPFRLKGIHMAAKSVALLPLTSSHVLLAGIASTTAEVHIHIWDLQYTVILASYVLSIPSSITSSPLSLSLTLISSTPSSAPSSSAAAKDKGPLIDAQAILVISPSSPNNVSKAKSKSKAQPSRSTPSTVFVIPCVIPHVSTIGNAMGKAKASAPWIALPESTEGNGGLDNGRRNALNAMKTAMEGKRPQAANEAFFKWEEKQGPDRSPYGYDFVKQVLEVMLQPDKNPASVMYSSEVIRHLVNRKAVSNGMIAGGLVRILKAKNDWESIKLAFMHVIDVSESEIVEALWDVVVANHGSDPDEMQVDDPNNSTLKNNGNDVPSLPTFLGYCVTYNTTPALLRLALRQQQLQSVTSCMPAAECAVEILHVLIEWVEEWARRDVPLLPAAVSKRNDGVWIAEGHHEMTVKNGEIPELDQIVSFAETFLDATFLTLLPHKSAQTALRRLAELLEPEISFTDSVQPLYGALSGFAKAHNRALRDAEEKGANGAVKGVHTGQEHQEDWRRRKKRIREQVAMGIRLYQVEELVL